jgi:hypothetical protein
VIEQSIVRSAACSLLIDKRHCRFASTRYIRIALSLGSSFDNAESYP